MTKKTLNNLKAGEFATLRFKHGAERMQFLGFTAPYPAHSKTPAYNTLREALWCGMGVYTLRDAAPLEDAMPYGCGLRAVFRDVDDDMTWEAYRFNGRWCYGSSADPLRFGD